MSDSENTSTKNKLKLWFDILDTLTPADWGDMEDDEDDISIEAGRQYSILISNLTDK
jgi:hypothetical protein